MARSVLVIGAGVVGVATAYALARRGLAVTVVDAAPAPGLGASYANGAQLSYAYSDALASPALLRHAGAILLGLDPAIRLGATADPYHWLWLARFLANASSGTFLRTTLAGLRLGLESRAALHRLLERHPLDFAHAATGKLHVHSRAGTLAAARRLVAEKRRLGARQQVLTRAEAIAVEPALADYPGPIAGAVHSPEEEVGDPRRFCVALAELLQREYGVAFRFAAPVRAIGEAAGAAWAELGRDGGMRLSRDALVVCAGIDARRLLGGRRLAGALMPMKGYSFTAPAGAATLRTSVTDVAGKIVVCPLGGRIRVAGLAEIAVSDPTVDAARVNHIVERARAILPAVADYDGLLETWAGVRPMSSDSLPIIRPVAERISVNIGHGMLGWTYAMGSAERLARLVVGEDSECA